MGLANLVPGISGGTMLLAAGVYPRFINGIAEVTTLRFRPPSLVVLAGVGLSASVAILGLAGVVKNLVVDHRWAMFSLFIGLTLGGVPVLWKLIGRRTPAVYGGALVGFVVMATLAIAQSSGAGVASGSTAGMPMFLFAGVAAASAMILPGVSGSYLLLIMDMYVPILSGVEALKEALKAADLGAAVEPVFQVVLPVGIGVVLGVVGVSNVLRVLLSRYEKATFGVLLGLLVGAVVGLYPFQEAQRPSVGDIVKGQVMTLELVDEVDPEDWPTAVFTPSPGQLGGSLGLGILGLGITLGVSVLGRGKD
jgi:putative membrane protein